MLLGDVGRIGSTFPLPVTTADDATTATDVATEVVQFYIADTGIADAGDPANTVVYGNVQFSSIQDSSKTRVGSVADTSFSWTIGTALTDMVEFPVKFWEGEFNLAESRATKMQKLADKFLVNEGEYCVDHRTGLIIGRKADASTTDQANYTYRAATSTASVAGVVTAKMQDGSGNALTSSGGALDVNIQTADAFSFFSDFGANATANVKATAGKVFSVWIHNRNAAERYLQLHRTATTPAGGAVPYITFAVPGNSFLAVGNDFFTLGGITMTTGIAFAFSTTEHTYTAGTGSEQTTMITYS